VNTPQGQLIGHAARRYYDDKNPDSLTALLETIDRVFQPPPDHTCDWCGKTDTENLADGFGPLVDVTVMVANGEEGFSHLLKYACQEHLEWLTDEFAKLGFVSHHHGSTTLLEDRTCPGYHTYGACPTPKGYGEEAIDVDE
jgi:hypothetical protein